MYFYICVYIYFYIDTYSIHAPTHIRKYIERERECVFEKVMCMYIYIYSLNYVYVYVHIYIYMCVCGVI